LTGHIEALSIFCSKISLYYSKNLAIEAVKPRK